MNRTVIFCNHQGEVVAQCERLQRQPGGNAAERAKQIRHGWRPAWVKDGQPALYQLPLCNELEPPPEIEEARIVALCVREAPGLTTAQEARRRQNEEAAFCRASGLLVAL